MSDITNPEVIRFCNEQVRPLCERARALKAKVLAADVAWQTLVAGVPNDASPLQDGREAEGVSRLTGQNLRDAMYGLAVALGGLSDAVISRPCVRPLTAE
jgi:hypothetical protein